MNVGLAKVAFNAKSDTSDVTPDCGNPVRLVATPLAGVPSAGVTKVGDVNVPVALVNTKAEGVPNAGVTRVGEVAKTNAPLPVSSDIAVFNSNDVPVNVLVVNDTDLLVKVSVDEAVIPPM